MSKLFVRAAAVVATTLALTATTAGVKGQGRPIGAFFDDFSAEWMRRRPSQSTQSRYFGGAEQDRLDRRLTPETAAWRRGSVEQARRGLKVLEAFDRSRMSDTERVSADLMQWQPDDRRPSGTHPERCARLRVPAARDG